MKNSRYWDSNWSKPLLGWLGAFFLIITLIFNFNLQQTNKVQMQTSTITANRQQFFRSLTRDFLTILARNRTLIITLAPLQIKKHPLATNSQPLFQPPRWKVQSLKRLATTFQPPKAFLKTTLERFWKRIRVYSLPKEGKLNLIVKALFAWLLKLETNLTQAISKINQALKQSNQSETSTLITVSQKLLDANFNQIFRVLKNMFAHLMWILEHPRVLKYKKSILWINLQTWYQTLRQQIKNFPPLPTS